MRTFDQKILLSAVVFSFTLHGVAFGVMGQNWLPQKPIERTKEKRVEIRLEKLPLLPSPDEIVERPLQVKKVEEVFAQQQRPQMEKEVQKVLSRDMKIEPVGETQIDHEVKREETPKPEKIIRKESEEKREKKENEKGEETVESPQPDPKAILQYQQAIKQKIQSNRSFPKKARRLNWEGEVLVSFRLHRSGKISELEVLHPSKREVFNEEAYKTVKKASPFPPIPDEIGRNEMLIQTSLVFKQTN